jgi:NAD(P)-dependent dehydrogenase (short-subunit alcohol dehydrogenase family)
MSMKRLLEGKVAIVTGASSGLGRAIAFAAEGAAVLIADTRTDPLEGGESTVDLITRTHGSAEFVRADVAAWTDVDALVSHAVARHGRLDVMVKNAMIFGGTGLLDTTTAEWQRVMRVNLTGMFYGCKRAVQQMVTQEPRMEVRGRIINRTGPSAPPTTLERRNVGLFIECVVFLV